MVAMDRSPSTVPAARGPGAGGAPWRSERLDGAPAAPFASLAGRTRDEHALVTSAAWWQAWAAAYLDQERWRGPLRTVVVRDGAGTIAGALPLATLRVAGYRLTACAGFYQPYRTVLVARDQVREAGVALADAVAQLEPAPGLRLAGCGDPDAGVQALLRRLREHGWAIYEEPTGSAYTAPLPATVEELEARLGHHLLHNVRYYERKMQRDGRVEHRLFHDAAPDAWARAVADLAAIEERSWMGVRGGDPRFAGAANARFWGTLLADRDASRAAHAFILYFDRRPVSFVFALDSGATRFVIANQYDESMHAYRTGSILYRRLFVDAIEKRRTLVHLGRGDTGYKAHWGAEPTRAMRDYVACRPTLSGRALFAALTLRHAAEQLRPERT